jgi:hypothetical protein
MGEIKSFGVLRLRTSQKTRGATLRMTSLWKEKICDSSLPLKVRRPYSSFVTK